MSRAAIVVGVVMAALVAVAWRTGGAIPVLGSIALFLGAAVAWPRIMQRRRRAERWVLWALKDDIEYAAELAEKADVRSLTACGHSPAYDALIKEASRMMPTYAKKLADDFIARAKASGEPRLLANAIALRAVVRARGGPYEDAIADASDVEAMPHATPTARAHAALARVIAGERAERFDEVRAVAIKHAALLADCTDDFGRNVVREMLDAAAVGDAHPVPTWRSPDGTYDGGERRRGPRIRAVLGPMALALLATVTVAIVVAAVLARRPSIAWWELFLIATFGVAWGLLHRELPADLATALARNAVRTGWAGELTEEELSRTEKTAEGCIVRARIAEREGRFADVLTATDEGLGLARDQFEHNVLLEMRVVALYAHDRPEDAERERDRLRGWTNFERVFFRTNLVSHVRSPGVRSDDVHRQRDPVDVPQLIRGTTFSPRLAFRDQMLAELLISTEDPTRRERLPGVLDVIEADLVLAHWCKTIAPRLLERARSMREPTTT